MAASESESLAEVLLDFLALLKASSSWRARLEAGLEELVLGREDVMEAVVEGAVDEDVAAVVVAEDGMV